MKKCGCKKEMMKVKSKHAEKVVKPTKKGKKS